MADPFLPRRSIRAAVEDVLGGALLVALFVVPALVGIALRVL